MLTEFERGSLLSPPAPYPRVSVVAVALRGGHSDWTSWSGRACMRHTKDVARSLSPQLDRVDLLDGAAPARSHVTTFAARAAHSGSRRGERAQKSGSHECGN